VDHKHSSSSAPSASEKASIGKSDSFVELSSLGNDPRDDGDAATKLKLQTGGGPSAAKGGNPTQSLWAQAQALRKNKGGATMGPFECGSAGEERSSSSCSGDLFSPPSLTSAAANYTPGKNRAPPLECTPRRRGIRRYLEARSSERALNASAAIAFLTDDTEEERQRQLTAFRLRAEVDLQKGAECLLLRPRKPGCDSIALQQLSG
jgi:hypothetical protein